MNAAHDEHADDLQQEHASDHRAAQRIRDEDRHVLGSDEDEHQRQRRGQPAQTPTPVMRPCALTVLTWRLRTNRSRISPARLSSTSARLPPDSRCVRHAVTKNLASSSGTRLAKSRSASVICMPNACRS